MIFPCLSLSVSSAFHRGPPGSRGPMIPPLLSLPPPPRGRGPIRGGLGPRSGPYGRGWWGVNAEPPFPGPGHGGPSRGGFHKEQRNPRRLKSWSLIKNTCPPKDGPQVMEGEVHFFMPAHIWYPSLPKRPHAWNTHGSCALGCPVSFWSRSSPECFFSREKVCHSIIPGNGSK